MIPRLSSPWFGLPGIATENRMLCEDLLPHRHCIVIKKSNDQGCTTKNG